MMRALAPRSHSRCLYTMEMAACSLPQCPALFKATGGGWAEQRAWALAVGAPEASEGWGSTSSWAGDFSRGHNWLSMNSARYFFHRLKQ